MASAADAPQIPTAPPDNSPKKVLKPINLATMMPNVMLATTEITTMATGCQPRACTCMAVMRRPSRATPQRSTRLATNSMPGLQRPSCDRKLMAMPSSRANSMTGAP